MLSDILVKLKKPKSLEEDEKVVQGILGEIKLSKFSNLFQNRKKNKSEKSILDDLIIYIISVDKKDEEKAVQRLDRSNLSEYAHIPQPRQSCII